MRAARVGARGGAYDVGRGNFTRGGRAEPKSGRLGGVAPSSEHHPYFHTPSSEHHPYYHSGPAARLTEIGPPDRSRW